MNTSRLARAAAVLLASSSLLSDAVERAEDGATRTLSLAQRAVYTTAVQSFRDQRYSAAYARFAQLADAGHVPSAHIALVMHDSGTALFNNAWAASLEQLRRWNALVVEGARAPLKADPSGD